VHVNRTPVRKTAAAGPGPAACESVQNSESESEVICMPVILASLTRTMIAAGSESSRRLVTPPDGAADSNATDSDGRGGVALPVTGSLGSSESRLGVPGASAVTV
jgi:hypothetical protein